MCSIPIVSYSRIAGTFSARTKRHTVGTLSSSRRQRSRDPARSVSAPSHGRVDPDLLQLHRLRRPGGGLGLEQDHAVLDPEPGALVLDLAAGSPAEPLCVPRQRIEPELLLVRSRTRRQQEVQIVERRRSKPRLTGVRWRADDEDRLRRAILARPRELLVGGVPQLASPRAPRRSASAAPRACRLARERAAACSGGHDIDAEMTQGAQLPSSASPTKRPSPRRATSSRNTRSTGSFAQNRRICSRLGSTSFPATLGKL